MEQNSSHVPPHDGGARKFGRRHVIAGLGLAGVGAAAAAWGLGLFSNGAAQAAVLVYKSPSCGCCGGWVRHMRAAGFDVTVRNIEDLDPIKKSAGVPDALISCHTALVGDYVIEGHVPAASVMRLLAEKPDVLGLAAPDMPAGSPGMEGAGREPYNVLAFRGSGATAVYARY